jgi:tRNA/tmRNA/rRNA uracil-C5-methylase (TrmA/RlmC/RlmD family)
VKSGDIAALSVDSLTLDGEGVGRIEQRTVLCRGVFPGERATVRIEAVSRQHARSHARSLALEQAHPQRRLAPCPNHEARGGRCAGCALMELDEAAQREAKRTMLRAQFGLEVDRVEPAPAPLGYRYSSKRVAFARRGELTLGSYARGSHEPAAMPGCLVDHPLLVRAFDAVERAARALAIAPYEEASGAGELRYVWAKTNGDEVVVTLITAHKECRVRELAEALRTSVSAVQHSVQDSRGNALRGEAAELLAGPPEITIALLGQQVSVGALGFMQPNPSVAAAAYGALTRLDRVAGRTLAFDLYAGAGITTRMLTRHFAQVVACEAHPESARALGAPAESVEDFLHRERSRALPRTPDLVVANPPRKGLGRPTCAALLSLAAPNLHLMSCGPEGLARDLAELSARYQLHALEAFDTLPQTPHVELVARLALR